MKLAAYPEGIFSVAMGIIEGAVEKVGSMTNGILNGAANVYDTAVAGIGSVVDGVGSLVPSFSMGSSTAPEQEVAQVRTPEIAPPVQQQSNYASIEDLGNLSAPNFGQMTGGQSRTV